MSYESYINKKADKTLTEIKGEKAMQIISDYPLYASTSGISYIQAIAIAEIIVPVEEWDEWLEQMEIN